MKWFSRRTPLQMALERGTREGADLSDELAKLRDYPIKSRADADAICGVLARIAREDPNFGGKDALRSLVTLFQEVEGTDCPAFPIMLQRGTRLLIEIVDAALEDPNQFEANDVLYALKILALYRTSEGTDAVVRAARKPIQPDGYMWHVILSIYAKDHPEHNRLFRELSEPLPSEFLGVALLDASNTAALEGAGQAHPFDSPGGKRQLERWLIDDHEEHYSYAISATAALPFISSPERDSLLAIALDHPSPDVQIEAAWVAARLGRDAGIRSLVRYCLDMNMSERARRYLEELGRADATPEAASDPSFRAKAEFAQWLAHPNELGRPPDEIEIIDHRELNWPPERERKPFWLLKHRVRDTTGLKDDDVGIGLVGSVTFCFFSYELEQRPPEDAYAIHCYWEMVNEGLLTEMDVDENSTEYNEMLRQCRLDGVTEARIILLIELSPQLNYPQHLVALARASRNEEPGWIVLDGPRSHWYAASEMPDAAWEKTVAMVHVGRVLLGFKSEPDRRRFRKPVRTTRTPEQILQAYERLLDKARSDAKQAEKLLGNHGTLGSAFDDYVGALVAVRAQSKPVCICAAYDALLAAVEGTAPSLDSTLFDSFSALGESFDSYVNALIELNRRAEVSALIERFRRHWDHNLGYGSLGSAAFRAGFYEIAEPFLVKLRQSLKDWFRSDEMNLLAEIWLRQRRDEDAARLLIDALKGLLEQSRSATGSDRKLFEEWFQNRRAAFLSLFPARGEAELRRNGIPGSTMAVK